MAEPSNLTQSEPLKKRSRARPNPKPAVAAPLEGSVDIQELLLRVSELSHVVEDLRSEVLTLRQAREGSDAPTESPDIQPSVSDPSVEENSAPQSPERGPFKAGPFDFDDFAADFNLAVANPEPVDWDSEFPAKAEPVAESADPFDRQEWLDVMRRRYPVLFEEIDRYNLEHGLVSPNEPVSFEAMEAHPLQDQSPEPEPATPAPYLDLSEPMQEDFATWEEEQAPTVPAQEEHAEPTVQIGFSAFHGGADVDTSEPSPRLTSKKIVPGVSPSAEALAAVPLELAAAAFILPLRLEGGTLHCLAAEPVNKDGLQGLGAALGLKVEPQGASISDVVRGLRLAYSGESEGAAREELLPTKSSPPRSKLKISWRDLLPRGLRRAS